MKAQSSGRKTSKERTAIAKTSATLVRSCKHCGRTALHALVNVQSGVSFTQCPSCDGKQFKFDDSVSDGERHAISVRLQGYMAPKDKIVLRLNIFDPKAATYV